MWYAAVVMLVFIAGQPEPVEQAQYEDMAQCVAGLKTALHDQKKQDVVKVECWTNVPGEMP